MFDVEAFILVGGRSSRMGSDKSQLMLGGESIADRLAEELSKISSTVRLVGSRLNPKPTLRNIADVHRDWGALGGIHAALDACRAERALIVACDLPFVSRELLFRLAEIGQKYRDRFWQAVVPVQSDLRPQPLCALYRRDGWQKTTESLIAGGEHTPRALLDLIATRWV